MKLSWSDDDTPPTLAINDVSADEGADSLTFTVSLSAISGQDVNLDYNTADGSAIAPDDYTAVSATLTIPAGSPNGNIAVTLIDDALSESSETFTINLSNPVNATIADNQGVGTITDNEVVLGVSHQETETGQSSNSATVTTSSILTASEGDLYIAAISSNANTAVNAVNGLGLNWALLSTQCAAGNKVGLEVWIGQGFPAGDGSVTAIFPANPANAVIIVSRYSGVDLSNPVIDVFSGNPTGVNGSCNSNSKSSIYLFNLTTATDGAIAYNAASATKNAQHSPGVNFTEHAEISQGNGNNQTMVAVQDKMVPLASNIVVDGSFDKTVEWAVIGLAINPANITIQAGASAVSSTGFNKRTKPNKSKMLPRKDSNETDKKMLTRKDSSETNETMMSGIKSVSGVQQIPQTIDLLPNYPNPFNSETRLEYAIQATTRVRIIIYNSRGQQVCKLVDEIQAAGYKTVTWNGEDGGGNMVSSGIYFYQLAVNGKILTRKMNLLK
jgi:hypothetical protein